MKTKEASNQLHNVTEKHKLVDRYKKSEYTLEYH